MRTSDRLIVGTVSAGSLSAALPSLLLAPLIILLSFLLAFPLSLFSLFKTLPIGAFSLFLALPLVALGLLRFCFQHPAPVFQVPRFATQQDIEPGRPLTLASASIARHDAPTTTITPPPYRLRSRSRPAACRVGEVRIAYVMKSARTTLPPHLVALGSIPDSVDLVDNPLRVRTIPELADLVDNPLRVGTIPELVDLVDHSFHIRTIPQLAPRAGKPSKHEDAPSR